MLNIMETNTNSFGENSPASAGVETSAALPVSKKVLWVEDDSFLKNIIAQNLSQQHLEVLYAVEGASVLQIAQKEQPAVIVLDILLPGIDGLEVLTRLKAAPETKHIPVLMFSNFDDKEKIEQSKALGAEDFFVKAVTPLEEIIEKIQQIISR